MKLVITASARNNPLHIIEEKIHTAKMVIMPILVIVSRERLFALKFDLMEVSFEIFFSAISIFWLM